MATEFNDAQHWGVFTTGQTLTSSTGKMVRQSELVLAALRAQGVFDNLVDDTTAPAHDKLWLDKNSDPAVLKEWDSVSSAWQTMTFDRLFGRASVTDLPNVGGTANAITADEPSPFMDGKIYGLIPTAGNTGATTIQIAGVATYDVVYPNGDALAEGELAADLRTPLLFANGRFEIIFGANAGSIKRAEVDASTFGFVAGKDATPADTSKVLPTVERAEAYADTKAPLKTSLTGSVPADSNPGSFLGYALNEWTITDNATVGTAAGSDKQAYGILLNHNFGGPTLRGTRTALSIHATLTAASEDDAAARQNYVALQPVASAYSDDNGTDTSTGAKGAVFPFNPVAILNSGATNILHLSAGEINIAAKTGSSLRYKSMFNFTPYSVDAVQGAEVDTMLWFYKQGATAVGFKNGLLFSDEVNGTTGLAPVATDGTIIAAKGSAIAKRGIDFSEWTFSGYFLFSKGFSVTGAGALFCSGTLHNTDAAGGKIVAVTSVLPDGGNDSLGKLSFGFQNQTTGADVLSAYIEATSNGAWAEGTSQASMLRFFATKTGSVTPGEQMRLLPDSVVAGKTAMFLNVEGTLVQVLVGAAGTGPGAAGKALYVA